MAKVWRIGNYVISNARKNCRFIFGDFFIRADMNPHTRSFEIRLRKTLQIFKRDEQGNIIVDKNGVKQTEIVNINDYVDIPAFKKFWGAQWKLMFDEFTEYDEERLKQMHQENEKRKNKQ